jgi:hypothetical protein
VPDYLVLKLTTSPPQGLATDWTPVVIARGVADEEAAAKQGYTGEGTYKVLPWDEDVEAEVAAGAPEVTMVSKSAIAEAEAAAPAEEPAK